MKALQFAVVSVLSTLLFISCSKDKEVTAPGFVMEGKWSGKIGTGPVTPASQFALNIKPGGVLQRVNSSGNVSGTGNWTMNENSFTATYTLTSSGTVVSLVGTLDKAAKKLTGSWTNSGDETGAWHATHE